MSFFLVCVAAIPIVHWVVLPFLVVLFSPSLFLGGAASLHLLCVVRFPLFLRLGAAFTSSSSSWVGPPLHFSVRSQKYI